MNENIKQIAIKSQVEHCISHIRLEQFANELIRECVRLIEEDDGSTNNGDLLFKHYGIKDQ